MFCPQLRQKFKFEHSLQAFVMKNLKISHSIFVQNLSTSYSPIKNVKSIFLF